MPDQGGLSYRCDVRGLGATAWTTKNPPNYVERSHVLLGCTVDAGRIWDVAATARYLRERVKTRYDVELPVVLIGQHNAAVWVAYAGMLEPDISRIQVRHIPETHGDAKVPQLLNVLRVCDVPEVIGMLAPHRVTLSGASEHFAQKVGDIFTLAGAEPE